MRQSDLSPPPDATGQKSDSRRDWPEFVDDDCGRKSVLGTAIVLILAVIAVALVWLIILGWRVAA